MKRREKECIPVPTLYPMGADTFAFACVLCKNFCKHDKVCDDCRRQIKSGWEYNAEKWDKRMRREAKADAGKLELDLVPMQIVKDIAEIRMYGNRKYGDPDNWKQVEMRRYVNAMLRHMTAFVEDYNSVDEESGLPHYKHIACNMAFICHMMERAK